MYVPSESTIIASVIGMLGLLSTLVVFYYGMRRIDRIS